MLFFKHHFYLLIGKEKYSCNSSRSIWRPKNNSYTADNLSQKHVTWHVCFFYDVSLIVFTRMMFFMFSLYFGRQSSCICNLVWWKSEQIRCYIRCINFATKVKCLICVTKHKWLSILHVLDQVKKCRIIRIVQLHDLL